MTRPAPASSVIEYSSSQRRTNQPPTLDRRGLLAGLAAAAACSATSLPATASAMDPLPRPNSGPLRLSLSAYALRSQLQSKDGQPAKMDLFDFVDYCAEQGISGAELTSYYFPEEVTPEYLFKLRRHCHVRGITVSGGAIRNDFCSRDPQRIERDLAHTRKWVEYYSVLGAPVIRIFAGHGHKDEPLDETLTRCAQTCEIACKHAQQHGISLALENHGGVTAYAKDLLKIVEQVKSPAFGINFDSGNFRSTDDPYAELEKIAAYTINAQIKTDVVIDGKILPADLGRVVQILKTAHYAGWITLEYESSNPLQAIPRYLKQLRDLIQ